MFESRKISFILLKLYDVQYFLLLLICICIYKFACFIKLLRMYQKLSIDSKMADNNNTETNFSNLPIIFCLPETKTFEILLDAFLSVYLPKCTS